MTIRFSQSKAMNEEMRAKTHEALKRNFPAATEAEIDQMMVRVDEAARSGGEARLGGN